MRAIIHSLVAAGESFPPVQPQTVAEWPLADPQCCSVLSCPLPLQPAAAAAVDLSFLALVDPSFLAVTAGPYETVPAACFDLPAVAAVPSLALAAAVLYLPFLASEPA